MDKINPLLYVTDHSPIPETVLDASGWFETEEIEVKVGEAVGLPRPGLPESALAWFIADGWVVSEKLDSGSRDVYTDDFTVHSYSQWTKYRLKRRRLQSERVLNDMLREFTEAYNEGREVNSARYEEILLVLNATLDNTETFLSAIESGYVTLSSFSDLMFSPLPSDSDDLKSRALVAQSIADIDIEKIEGYISELETFATEVTAFMTDLDDSADALDESAKTLDDLVVALAVSADELGAFASELIAAKAALNSDIASDIAEFDIATLGLADGLEAFSDESNTMLDGYGDSLREQINKRFDALLSTQRQGLISRGLYNSTVWNRVESGIEADRSTALSDLEDKIAQQKIGVKTGAYDRRFKVRGAELDAKSRKTSITSGLHEQLFRFHDQKLRVHAQGLQVKNNRLALHDQAMKITDQGLRINSEKLRVHDQKLRVIGDKVKIRSEAFASKYKSIGLLSSIYETNSTFRMNLAESKQRLGAQILSGKMGLAEARNSILTSMVNFMERRSDEYPGLESLSAIAAQLGYSQAGTVSPGGSI